MPTTSPYPGLRSFQPDQADIFFGREAQTDDLLRKLAHSRFLGVVGPSGCGKSSLVMAGMISALETGFMASAGARWKIAIMRPGSHPLRRLAEALMSDADLGFARSGAHALPFLEAALRRGPRGLVEAVTETPLPPDTNLLVLVDQFEEIFRLRTEENRNEQDAFVALILETVAHRDLPIYVVITMRSDYLGDCALFPGLPEALNQSQYLTPRMDREQRRAAIVGPARVFGGDVAPDLLNRILNETGADPNQLPVLQHLLMRMWEATPPTKTGRAVVPFFADMSPGMLGHVLGMSDYEKVGGLSGALSMHADQAYDSLNAGQKRIAQSLFRSLCEGGTGRRDGRRPTSISVIAERAGVPPDQVMAVVEVFRNLQYGFLLPPPAEALYANSVVDITHESLIRLWQRLSQWVEEETKSAETYRFLEQTARRWREKEAALWGTPNLEIALAWKDREQPTSAWAERYGGNYALAVQFLEASAAAQQKQKDMAHKAYVGKLIRARVLAISFGAVALVLAGFILLHHYLRVWEHVGYYNSFVKINGEPMGVGEMSFSQVKHRPVSIRIVKKGKRGHVLRMEAVNSQGELTARYGTCTYLESSDESKHAVAKWVFNYTAAGRPGFFRWIFGWFDQNAESVAYEETFDERGARSGGFVYLPPSPDREDLPKEDDMTKKVVVRTGYYVDANGYPLLDKRSATFVEIAFEDSAKGFDEYRRYRNRGGQAVRGPGKAFGQVLNYDKKGELLEKTALGPKDEPVNDSSGKATLRVRRADKFGNPLEVIVLDASGKVTATTDGWSIRKSAYDPDGNIAEISHFDSSGQPTIDVKGYHKIRWERDGQGNIVKEIYLDATDKPTVGDEGCYSQITDYGAGQANNFVRVTCRGVNEKPTVNIRGFAGRKEVYDSQKRLREVSFYDDEGRRVKSSDGYARETFRYNESGKLSVIAYWGVDGALVPNKKGYAQVVKAYDRQRHCESYLGTKGEPVISDKGYAKVVQAFDSYGNIVCERYFAPGGDRIVSVDGHAGWTASYNPDGNRVERVYLNAQDSPLLGKEGYAGWRSDYNHAENEVRRTYIGEQGQRTLSSDGVAGYTSEYNALGNESGRKYFGVDQKPITHRQGYCSWTAQYDVRGNIVEIRYFDLTGNPTTVCEDGNDTKSCRYAYIKKKYNAQSKIVEEAYYGVDDEPCLNQDGWARAVHTYDSRGQRVESNLFGVFGERVLSKMGYSAVTQQFNDQGNVVDIKHYDTNGDLVASTRGFAHLVLRYDAYGKLIEREILDAKGAPTLWVYEGFHKDVLRYDAFGRVRSVAYFAEDGSLSHQEGYHSVHYVYDNFGNVIERSYIDPDGNSVMNKVKRYATVQMIYDVRGNVLETDYFDANGKLTESNEGYAKVIRTYNYFSQMTSEAYYNEQGKPTQEKYGYAATRMQYDPQGRIISQVYLNVAGDPVLIPCQGENRECGYASYQAKYDSYGNQIEVAYFGTDENPVKTKSGYHRRERKFNSRRQIVEQTTFDDQGRMVLNADNYARLLNAYDARGNITEMAAFDERGHPSEACYGYAVRLAEYDQRGRLVADAYLGADFQPKVLSDGCARHAYSYDSEGNQVEDECFGKESALAGGQPGYVRRVRTFDARRQITEETCFGDDGQPVRLNGSAQHVTKFRYDPAGNKIEENYFGVQGEPVSGISPDGELCAKWTAKYDVNKNMIEKKCH